MFKPAFDGGSWAKKFVGGQPLGSGVASGERKELGQELPTFFGMHEMMTEETCGFPGIDQIRSPVTKMPNDLAENRFCSGELAIAPPIDDIRVRIRDTQEAVKLTFGPRPERRKTDDTDVAELPYDVIGDAVPRRHEDGPGGRKVLAKQRQSTLHVGEDVRRGSVSAEFGLLLIRWSVVGVAEAVLEYAGACNMFKA